MITTGLATGIYFWEYGVDRAARFAYDQQQRGKVQVPAVVGAIIQLGNCFDLMDTRYMDDLGGPAMSAFQWNRHCD